MCGSTSVLFFVIATVLLHLKVGAQPGNGTDKGVAEYSSPESHPTDCIRSLVDLRQAYLDLKTVPGSRPEESTIFSFYPTDVVKYTSLALFYEFSVKNGTNQPTPTSHNSKECCNPENAGSCKVFFRHRSHLYRALCPPLIFLYAFPKLPNHVWKSNGYNRKLNKYMMKKLCWKVPPFCTSSQMVGGSNGPALLADFTAEFPHLVLSANEGPIQVGPVDEYDPDDWEKDKLDIITSEEKLTLHSVILSVFIMTIPLFLLAMDTYGTTISTVLIKSRFAANCLHMVKILSWGFSFYFIFYTVQILRVLLRTAQSSEKYLHDHLMPDAVLCFTIFGVEAAVILTELPFICCYFWRSPVVRDVYKKKSGLLKLRKGAESSGWTGIVVFCQVCSVMMCHMAIFLFIDPLYTITRVGNTVLVVLFITVITFYLGIFCANCCSCASCTCQRCHKYFVVTMVMLVIFCANYFAYHLLPDPFREYPDTIATGVLSSVASSAMLALFGYTCKKLVWNRITQDIQEFDHMTQNRGNNDELTSSMNDSEPKPFVSAEQ